MNANAMMQFTAPSEPVNPRVARKLDFFGNF